MPMVHNLDMSPNRMMGYKRTLKHLWKGLRRGWELPVDRWPKHWVGKYRRPVVLPRIALYGHPDSGGLWEMHCEKMLIAVGFIMPDPEGWPSVFFHPQLKLLLVVYVDDFKMSGPKEVNVERMGVSRIQNRHGCRY